MCVRSNMNENKCQRGRDALLRVRAKVCAQGRDALLRVRCRRWIGLGRAEARPSLIVLFLLLVMVVVSPSLFAETVRVDFRNTNITLDFGSGTFEIEDIRAPGRLTFCGRFQLPAGARFVRQTRGEGVDFNSQIVDYTVAGVTNTFEVVARRDDVSVKAPHGVRILGEVLAGDPDETATHAVRCGAVTTGFAATMGPAVPAGADGVFDRRTDTLYQVRNATLGYDRAARRYTFDGGDGIVFETKTGVLAKEYDIDYRTIRSVSGFETPPVGWMTWYAVMFDASERTVLENARGFKEKFGGYTDAKPVLWVDWEWDHSHPYNGSAEADEDMLTPRKSVYPNGLKYVADELKALGFTQALWISLVGDTNTNALFRAHPDWILGNVSYFPGRIWGDPTAPGYCEKGIPAMIDRYRAWGYEAFKWDGLYPSVLAFTQFRARQHDPKMTSMEVLKRMARAVRKSLGDDTYLLGCAATSDRVVLPALDTFDAVRVGGDIFTWSEFLRRGVGRLLRYYPLHNTMTYCDADNLVLRDEHSTFAQARTRVTIYGLSGVPITLGDRIAALDERRIGLLRRVMPVVPTRSVALKPVEVSGQDLDLTVDVARDFGSWQLKAWSNFRTNETRTVRFAAPGCVVWDYWNDRLVTGDEIAVPPCDTALVRVTPIEKDRPTLVSVSRHLAQGAYEIVRYEADARGARGVVKCPGGEPVVLTFRLPDGTVRRVKVESAVKAEKEFSLCL